MLEIWRIFSGLSEEDREMLNIAVTNTEGTLAKTTKSGSGRS